MTYLDQVKVCPQGKYKQKEKADPEARLNKYKGRYAEAESRYGAKPNVTAAVQAYCLLARQAGMQPHELAIRSASYAVCSACITLVKTGKQAWTMSCMMPYLIWSARRFYP